MLSTANFDVDIFWIDGCVIWDIVFGEAIMHLFFVRMVYNHNMLCSFAQIVIFPLEFFAQDLFLNFKLFDWTDLAKSGLSKEQEHDDEVWVEAKDFYSEPLHSLCKWPADLTVQRRCCINIAKELFLCSILDFHHSEHHEDIIRNGYEECKLFQETNLNQEPLLNNLKSGNELEYKTDEMHPL